jgi:hypothetical protein
MGYKISISSFEGRRSNRAFKEFCVNFIWSIN